MTEAFDPRIVRVGIEIDGAVKTFEDLAIVARGVKYACPILSECEVKIFNLTRHDRDYLLTTSSPYRIPRTPKSMFLEVGRKSTGAFRLFTGHVIACNPTPPPDIGITLKSLTASFFLGALVARNQAETAPLSAISRSVAGDLGLSLDFQAADKHINNYSYSGAALRQLDKLAESGGVDAFIDNDKLIVKQRGKPLAGGARLVSKETGMIGVPEVTEQGIRVKMLIDNSVRLGGAIDIKSDINPAANGQHIVYKMGFEAANRDTPFYLILESTRFLI